MKKFKKLIPALCMLLVSAVLVGTSTYAWFSMNDTVSATNLQITAKSDSVYLLIGKGELEASAVQTGKLTTVAETATGDDVAMLPSAHKTISKEADAVAKEADVNTNYSNWYYKNADAPDSSASTGVENKLTDTSFSQYVIKYTYSLVLAKGSNSQGKINAQVVIAKEGTQTNYEPVRVLVTTATNAAEFAKTAVTGVNAAGTDNENRGTAVEIYSDGIDDTTVVLVNVYVYYNGEHADVNTNNIANLAGGNISVYFTVED